jgi:hypothetical protein
MRYYSIIGLFLFAVHGSSPAHADVTLKALSALCSSQVETDRNTCSAYILGIIDVSFLFPKISGGGVCIPENVQHIEVARSAVVDLQGLLEKETQKGRDGSDMAASLRIIIYLARSYPCQ